MNAIILVGGLGSRIKELFPDIPKPLIPINGKPFLDILIRQISNLSSIDKVILAVGYKKEAIKEHFKKFPCNLPLEFSEEEKPLGTGGALKEALKRVTSENVLVLNGDSFVDFDFTQLYSKHLSSQADATLGFFQVKDASRYGTLNIDFQEDRIEEFNEKKEEGVEGFINAGVYLIKKSIFEHYETQEIFSLEKDIFPLIASKGKMYGVSCQKTFIDIGTKDAYIQAQTILRFLTDES
jgi:NDP-sugar pyrophosphorylase family protein